MAKRKSIQKLRSTQGTSIFFGILFFLIASILSIVMLNGAVTAVKNVQSDKKTEQNFLTCSSAAKTLRDAITGTKVIRKNTVIYENGSKTSDTTDWSAEVTGSSTASGSGTEMSAFGTAYLVNWLKNLAENQTSGGTMTQKLTLQGPYAEKVNPVTATVTITEDKQSGPDTSGDTYVGYDIWVVLETGEGLDSCQMTFKLSGTGSGTATKKDETTGRGTNQVIKTTINTTITYTWNSGRIMYGSEPETEAAAG